MLDLIGSIGGALLGFIGGERTNASNAKMSREQMAWNSEEAFKMRQFNATQAAIARNANSAEAAMQRDWSTDMSGSSYQRAVADMKAAGLNPMLAYSQGGSHVGSGAAASSPAASASAAHSVTPIPKVNSIAAALASAQQAQLLENLAKSGKNIDADTQLKEAQARQSLSSAGQIDYLTKYTLPEQLRKIDHEVNNIMQDTRLKVSQGNLNDIRNALAKVEIRLKQGEIDQVEARTALTKVEEKLKQLEIPISEAFSEKFKGEWGKNVTPWLREILDILRVLVYSGKR